MTVEFIEQKSMGERDWGEELLIGISTGNYIMKKLTIKAGAKGGLQKHHIKDECGILISGKLIIRYDSGNGKLKERVITQGESFRFPPGSVHQEEAITECVIIECSTPHANDRIRCEEDYGQKIEGGLPSTKREDVIIL